MFILFSCYTTPVFNFVIHLYAYFDFMPLLIEVNTFLIFFQQVQGIWAQNIEDATCASVNHKYRLIAFGRKK
jgi:hypothetical protein